jgi:hypothetical protein
VIPADELNAIVRREKATVFIEPVPSAVFEKVGDYFIKLLRGELNSEQTDARF